MTEPRPYWEGVDERNSETQRERMEGKRERERQFYAKGWGSGVMKIELSAVVLRACFRGEADWWWKSSCGKSKMFSSREDLSFVL